MARFSDILTIVNGKDQSKVENPNGKYPIYGSGGVMGYADDYLCGAETVVIGRKGSINKPIYVEVPFWNVDTAFGLVANRDVLLPKYLFYFCVYFDFEQLNTTVTIPSLTKANLLNIEMNLPTLRLQNEIVARLSKVDELIALRKEQIAKLDQLVKSRFIELFGDLHSTKFPKCKMAEICNIKHGYAFSGEFFTEEDNNILLVTPGNFKVGGGFQEKKCKFFMGEYSEEYVLNCGDLIVTMTDLSKNMDTLGYSAIVPSTNRVYLHNQRIGLFVDMSENINKVFLMYFMQTNEYRDSIITSATGSTVHHTSPSKILDCDVFLPPIELQDQFATFVEQTDKSKLAIQQSLSKLELLKKSLMQEYFG